MRKSTPSRVIRSRAREVAFSPARGVVEVNRHYLASENPSCGIDLVHHHVVTQQRRDSVHLSRPTRGVENTDFDRIFAPRISPGATRRDHRNHRNDGASNPLPAPIHRHDLPLAPFLSCSGIALTLRTCMSLRPIGLALAAAPFIGTQKGRGPGIFTRTRQSEVEAVMKILFRSSSPQLKLAVFSGTLIVPRSVPEPSKT